MEEEDCWSRKIHEKHLRMVWGLAQVANTILVQIQMQRKILTQIQNVKPVKMVEGLTEVAIDAFPHHCRIEVFAEKENMNKRRSFLSVDF